MPSAWIEKRRGSRGVRYRVAYRVNGRRGFDAWTPYKVHAEQLLRKRHAELWAGKLGVMGQRLTVDEFCALYLDHCRSHKAANTVSNFDEPAMKSFSTAFRGPLANVRSADVEQWKLALNLSPATVSMRIRCVKAALAYGVKMGYLTANPASGILAPRQEVTGHVLTNEEVKRLLEALPTLLRHAAIVALHTGLRRGELLAMDWSAIRRRDDGIWAYTIDVGKTKTGRGRVVPLHPEAINAMGEPRPKGPVWGKAKVGHGHSGQGLSVDVLEQGLRQARDLATIPGLRWHDLRHTWATRYMEKTGDLFGLMQLGGWRSVNSLAHYQHLTRGRSDGILALDFGMSATRLPSKDLEGH